MIEDRKNIDKLFHDVLFNNEHDVPDYVWDNIQDELLRKKRMKNRMLLRNIAASIIIMLTFASGYFFSDLFRIEKEKSSQTLTKNKNLEIKEVKNEKDDNNSDKKSINLDKKINNEFVTQQQNNITFQNKNKNEKFLSNTEKEFSEINNNIKSKEQVAKKNLLANSDESENFNKSPINNTYNDKITYKKLQLLNADKIDAQLKSEGELVYSLRQVPVLNIEDKKKKEARWSVEGQFSPLYAYRDVKEVDAIYEASANSNVNSYRDNSEEKPISAFSVGANIKYKISERLKFQTGVYYSETGQIIKNAMLFSESMYNGRGNTYLLNTSVGNVIEASNTVIPINNVDNLDFSNSTISDIIQNFDYLEIPAIIKYKIIDKKIDVNVLSGINTGILIGNNVTVKNDEGKFKVGKTTDINSVIYSGMLGINLVYPLYKNFSFCIEPTFKYSLKSINKYNSVYPYSFAVFSGINFQF
ncbi:MAG: outer membrane beta-barrel protein [Bacteroidales bacterium]|nr:outer membrane beta-barrel protein [Bacteroidales bacterium]